LIETPPTGRVEGGVYITAFPGERGQVHISLEVIDRILAEVLRGFGAVPKRGAEVGGILLGSSQSNPDPLVRILDFAPVPIEYRRGPSFLLSETDLKTLDQVLGEARRHPHYKPIGFFRSHTRDAPGITGEDRTVFDRFFPAAGDVFLLIHPSATRVSTAGFLARNGRELPDSPASQFPFRTSALDPSSRRLRPSRVEFHRSRGELQPPEPPPPFTESSARSDTGVVQRPRSVSEAAAPLKRSELEAPPESPPPQVSLPPLPPRPITAWTPEFIIDSKEGKSRPWGFWSGLAVLVVAISLSAGYFAYRFGPQPLPWISSTTPAGLGLTAKSAGAGIEIHWDRTSPIVSQASSATLVIADGAATRTISLSPGELRSGTTVYEPSSNNVRIQLHIQSSNGAACDSIATWTR
jgi:hypothetical protein